MKKRILSSIVALSLMLALASCGSQSQNTEGQSADTSSASSETATEKESTSAKKKYQNISADTKPIGVSDIKFEDDNGKPYVSLTVSKNDSKIEESNVKVAFEVYDENDKYMGEFAMITDHSLIEGDTAKLRKILFNGLIDGKYTNDVLVNWSAKVTNIEEVDVAEAEAAEELADLMYDIKSAIYNKNYNRGLTMLEMAKEEYPDSKELKIFEAEIKDLLAKEGIDMEGNKITEEESTTKSAE